MPNRELCGPRDRAGTLPHPEGKRRDPMWVWVEGKQNLLNVCDVLDENGLLQR